LLLVIRVVKFSTPYFLLPMVDSLLFMFSNLVKMLVGGAGHVLEPPDQKIEFFLFLVAISWWFHFYVHKVFGEMSVRV
jgi:hypothetical protein